jgi:RNA polymerase sigma-70 factor (ECF subfamily)
MAGSAFEELSDAQLLVASQSDPDAFAALYDRWAQPLLAYFARRVRDAEVAADLTAETLALVFEKRTRFRDTGAPASAWLYTIAGRQLASFARRRKVEMRAFDRLCLERPEIDDVSREAIEALFEQDGTVTASLGVALEAVPDREREAVELRVVEELSYREIAERMDCTVVAARVRVHRGLHRLNQLMEIAT